MHKQLRGCVAAGLLALIWTTALAVTTSADSLLAVDQNRSEIVAGLVEKWKDHLNAGKADELRKTLMNLRADKLLAVSLAQDQKQFAALLEKDDFLPLKESSARAVQAKALGEPNTDVVYVPVTPCRLFYTEIASGGAGGALLPGVTRTFDTRGSLTGQGGAAGCEVPSTATAIVLQMGAFSSFGLGWINAGPEGTPIPSGVLMAYNNVAFINATSVVLKLNPANGQFWGFSNNNRTELYGDVLGYFAAPSTGNGLRVIQTTGAVTDSPNVINGSANNSASGQGATVAGGGFAGNNCLDPPTGQNNRSCGNRALDFFATVGGGANNTAADSYSTVAGGYGNTASGSASTVAGGDRNIASGDYSAVAGGELNIAAGARSMAAGRRAKANHDGSFVWGDSTNADVASTGPNQFVVRATGGVNIGDGAGNGLRVIQTTGLSDSPNVINGSAANSVEGATVQGATIAGGGYSQTNCADPPTGSLRPCANRATANAATVSGGVAHLVSGAGGTIGGGVGNTASGSISTVAGGDRNIASGANSAVAGGQLNTANSLSSTIGGGQQNTASNSSSTVGGGALNTASGDGGTVAGGLQNTASGIASIVAGGQANAASGIGSMVPGGVSNTASGVRSFAAGTRAKAINPGSFVWADSTDRDFFSTTSNEFSVRSTGGARIVSAVDGLGAATAGVALAAGGGSWTSLSDVNAKRAFGKVNAKTILAGVLSLPITTWQYKSQDASIRHIGPTAQDFKRAFGVGETDVGITGIDADGVALAAIQGLNQKLMESNRAKDAKISAQASELATLKREMAAIKKKLGL